MDETTDTDYLKALSEITVFDFIKDFATKAYEEKCILEIPHQTFQKINVMYHEDCKQIMSKMDT